jgi:hypothetical protein
MTGETRCRVCGLRQDAPIWGSDGQSPTFETCACCGTTFGKDDTTPEAIRARREKWRAEGTQWADPTKKPEGWRLEEQIARVPRFLFRILPSLRGAGPGPVPFHFAGTGAHADGFIVQFIGIRGGQWVGNFQRGIGTKDAVLPVPLHTDRALVIAGGMGYVVDLESRTLIRTFGGAVSELFNVPARDTLVLGNGLWFECEGPEGLVWRTRRISVDGMRDVWLEGERIHGLAFDLASESWLPFEVDVVTGAAFGGVHPSELA